MKSHEGILSLPGDQASEVQGSQGWAPCRGSREGPSRLSQLLGAPGIRPWAGGRLPPVSAPVSTWLLLCVRVSPLLCLIRTLSLGLGPPPSKRTSSQTFTPSCLQRTYFHVMSSSEVLGGHEFSVEGDFQPTVVTEF